MRRKEREITGIAEIKEILDSARVLRIGIVDGDYPYIVPVNFGYSMDEDGYEFYFHGAGKGRKAELLSDVRSVSVEIDEEIKLITGELACDHSYSYKSIMAEGMCSPITDKDEKIKALNRIMVQLTGKEFEYNDKMFEVTAVWKIRAEKVSAKANI